MIKELRFSEVLSGGTKENKCIILSYVSYQNKVTR
jgi:hypothetical protein